MLSSRQALPDSKRIVNTHPNLHYLFQAEIFGQNGVFTLQPQTIQVNSSFPSCFNLSVNQIRQTIHKLACCAYRHWQRLPLAFIKLSLLNASTFALTKG
jgi:hypothetical protein